MTPLQIAPGLLLPPDAATGRFVLFAKSGYGKTNADAVLTEAFIAGAHVPTIVMDPLGNMRGLRSSADGEKAGLPIAIFGGDHGDLPLPVDRAEYIADMLAEGISAVLDLREVTNVEEFAAVFLPRLLRRAQTNMHVIFEEGDRFARNTGKVTPVTQFCRASRNAGIGWTFSTQKPQVLHREITDTANVFVAMRMTGELAQEAMAGEIGSRIGRRTAAKMIADLPSLARGEAWFIPDTDWLGADAPEWEPSRIRFRLRETFEVKPPKVGQQRREPKVLAEIDLARLRRALVANTDPNDATPAGTRNSSGTGIEIIERERIVERPVLTPEHLETIRTAVDAIKAAEATIRDAASTLSPIVQLTASVTTAAPALTAATSVQTTKATPRLTGGPAKMLATLAAYRDGRATRTQLGILTGYAPTGGTFGTYLSRLRSAGLIVGDGSEVSITDAGRAVAGDQTPVITSEAVIALWLDTVKGGPRKILDALVRAYPRGIPRLELGDRTGYESSSGTFGTYLSRLKSLELIETRGATVIASSGLFPSGPPSSNS